MIAIKNHHEERYFMDINDPMFVQARQNRVSAESNFDVGVKDRFIGVLYKDTCGNIKTLLLHVF